MGDLKELGHLCPTCEQAVFAKRSDRKFCTISGKNKHHAAQRYKLSNSEMELFKFKRRNLTILDGILGDKSKKMKVKKSALVAFNFKLHECEKIYDRKRNKVVKFRLLNFTIHEIQPGILMIQKSDTNNVYDHSLDDVEKIAVFHRRWLLEFPDYQNVYGPRLTEKMVIQNYGAWRE